MDNLTNLTSAKNFFDIVEFSNNATNGVLGWVLVVFLFVMFTLMFMRRYTFEEGVLGASFLCLSLSIFLRLMELIDFSVLITLGVIFIFSGVWVYWSKK